MTMVVYVHGLWHHGSESLLLRRRLARELGAKTCTFSYPSVRGTVAANARALGHFLEGISSESVHIVAHSLGGLVTLELFERWMSADGKLESGHPLPPGRIVLLGSPVRGSQTAQRLARLSLGRRILGHTVRDALLHSRLRQWTGARDLGVLAGVRAVGLGRLVSPLRAANDGTVLVEETSIEGAADRLLLPVSHSGMVFSALLARRVAAFLRHGRFLPELKAGG